MTTDKRVRKRVVRGGQDSSSGGNDEELARYRQIFEEIRRFTGVVETCDGDLDSAREALAVATAAQKDAKKLVQDLEAARDGAKQMLVQYLTPKDGELMPLFDRMDPPDEERHGERASEWRHEPIGALRLSMPAQASLVAADVMLVGQLQDRMQAEPQKWWEPNTGLTAGMAAAIADQMADFINERTGR